VQQATGTSLAPYAALTPAAWRGREREVGDLIEIALGDVSARGENAGVRVAQWAKAVLENGLGRHGEAMRAARAAIDFPHDPGTANWSLSELVEAAAKNERPDVAAEARAPGADHARRRNRLGARDPGSRTRADERRRRGGAPPSRGDRAARAHPRPRLAQALP
jgi:hypothetical protein